MLRLAVAILLVLAMIGGADAKSRKHHKHYASNRESKSQIVEHPSGCPHVAFCGCGTAGFLLGKIVRYGGLAIAANWMKFPKAAPAPMMAAVKRHHVFAILKVLPGNKVLAYDPNSGGHKTRIHVRSLAGYRVVNPHGSTPTRYVDYRFARA